MKIAIKLKKGINEFSVHELKSAYLSGEKLTFAVSSMESGGNLLGDYYMFNLVSVSDEPPTETPEEKEALDAIEQVEWKGEGLPPVGAECEFKEENPSGLLGFSDWTKCTVLAYNKSQESSDDLQIIIRDYHGDAAIIYSCDKPLFRKPETQEAKKEREELEARKRLIDSSELPNGSKDKVGAILTMVEDVYGSGALFSVVDLLEGFNCESGRCLQDK